MKYKVKSPFIDTDEHFYDVGIEYPVEGTEADEERIEFLLGSKERFSFIVLDTESEPTQEELLKRFYKKTSADSMKEILVSHEIEFDESADKQALFDLILEKEIDILTK